MTELEIKAGTQAISGPDAPAGRVMRRVGKKAPSGAGKGLPKPRKARKARL